MSHYRLSRPGQPAWKRLCFGMIDFLASLRLAVVLIALYAAVLGGATFVESRFDAAAVQHGIYGALWFGILSFLLGLNVLCSALVRFPWKRSQIGFLLTHSGILLLLVGAWLTREYAVYANLSVPETQRASRMYLSTSHLRLDVRKSGGEVETKRIPFVAGAFNWDLYENLTWNPFDSQRLFCFPWGLAQRDRGVLYDEDGVRLEVVDYLADSETVPVPRIQLAVASKRSGPAGEAVVLAIRSGMPGQTAARLTGIGQRKSLPNGSAIAFWMTGDSDETEAFQKLRPSTPLPACGEVGFYARGKTYSFPLDALLENQKSKKTAPLGDSGLQVEVIGREARICELNLAISGPDSPPEQMTLFADRPEWNQQDYRHRVFGEFWLNRPSDDRAEKSPHSAASDGPRIDILRGHDRRLYARAYRDKTYSDAKPFDSMAEWWPGTSDAFLMRLLQFEDAEKPAQRVKPLAFSKKNPKDRQARVRLTVDQTTEEFWLPGAATEIPTAHERYSVNGKNRTVTVSLLPDFADLGFQVLLHKFSRKYEPGSTQASHFSSVVDFLDQKNPPGTFARDVLITMNVPATCTDPVDGRSYRLYQSSWKGPVRPGDREFEQWVDGKYLAPDGQLRQRLSISVLSANYDPGRGMKYAGSLLLAIGMAVVFAGKPLLYKRKS